MATSKKLRIGIAILILLVIGAIASPAIIRSIMVERINTKLHDEFGGAATYDTISTTISPPTALITNLRFATKSSTSNKPIIQLDTINLVMTSAVLYGRPVHVTDAQVHGIHLNITHDANGESNITRFTHELPPTKRKADIPVDKLSLDEILITDTPFNESKEAQAVKDENVIKITGVSAANVILPPRGKKDAHIHWESLAIEKIHGITRPVAQTEVVADDAAVWLDLGPTAISGTTSAIQITLNSVQVGQLDPAANQQPLFKADTLKIAVNSEIIDGGELHITDASIPNLAVAIAVEANGESSFTRLRRILPHANRAGDVSIDKLVLDNLHVTAYQLETSEATIVKVKNLTTQNVVIPPSGTSEKHRRWDSIAIDGVDILKRAIGSHKDGKDTDRTWAHLDKATVSSTASPFDVILNKLQLGYPDEAAGNHPLIVADVVKLTLTPESADGEAIHLTDALVHGLNLHLTVDAHGDSSLARFMRELPLATRTGNLNIDKILLDNLVISAYLSQVPEATIAYVKTLSGLNIVFPPSGKAQVHPNLGAIEIDDVEILKRSTSANTDGKNLDRKWAHLTKATVSTGDSQIGVTFDKLQLGQIDAAAANQPLFLVDALQLTLTPESANGSTIHLTDAKVHGLTLNISVDARGESSFNRFLRELPYSNRASEIPIDKLLFDSVDISTFVAKEQGGFGLPATADSIINVKSVSATNYIIPPSGKLLSHEQWTAVTLDSINAYAPFPEQKEVKPCIRIGKATFELLQALSTHEPVRLKHFNVEQSSSITDYSQATLPISRAVTAIQQGFGVKEPKELHDAAPDATPHGTGLLIEDLNLTNTRIETLGIDGTGRQAYWTLTNAAISGSQVAFGADDKSSSSGSFKIDSATESSSGSGRLALNVTNLTGSYPMYSFGCDYQIENLAAPVFSSKAQKADGTGIVAGSMTMSFSGGATQGQLNIEGSVTLSDDFEITGDAVKRLGIKIAKGTPIQPVTILGPLTKPQIKMPSELAFLRGMIGNVIFAGPVAILDTVADNTPLVGPAMKEVSKGLKILGKIPKLFK